MKKTLDNSPSTRGRAIALLSGVALAIGASAGNADVISFDLGFGNSAISGFAPPYANVNINESGGTTATITFTSLTAGGNIYLMGDGSTAALNVNSTSFTVDTFISANAGTGFSAGSFTPNIAAGQQVDGAGKFNLTIDDVDGFKNSVDTLSFIIHNSGNAWSGAADVLTDNLQGFAAASHIFVTTSPAVQANGALATGFAANANNGGGGGNFIPEPGSLALLGVALLGIGAVVRRRS